MNCLWRCGDETPDHAHFTVIVREGRRLLGRLTPDGHAARNKVHAAIMSRERADKVALAINGEGMYTAVVRPF